LKSQKIRDAINAVGVALGHYYFWPFLMKESLITTVDDYKTGNADVTFGSATVIGGSTVWTGMAGRLFKATGFEEAYRITTVVSPTEITLETTYSGTTRTDVSYVIAQDEYHLNSDYDGILNIVRYVGPDNLDIVTPERIDRSRFGPFRDTSLGETSSLTVGLPKRATIVSRDDGTNNHLYKIVFDPFPDRIMVVPIKYYALLAEGTLGTETWPFPFYLEQVIVDGASGILRYDGQDDARGGFNLQQFFNSRNEIAGLTPTHAMTAQFQPDTGILRQMHSRKVDRTWMDIQIERS
jgi:hypothetical protein